VKWFALSLILMSSYSFGAPYLTRDGGYVKIVNPDQMLYWCWLEVEGRGFKSMWLRPGTSSLWELVGRRRFSWGCK